MGTRRHVEALGTVPPPIVPTESVMDAAGSTSRVMSRFTAWYTWLTTISGSVHCCGAEVWPPRPWMRTASVSSEELVTPGV